MCVVRLTVSAARINDGFLQEHRAVDTLSGYSSMVAAQPGHVNGRACHQQVDEQCPCYYAEH